VKDNMLYTLAQKSNYETGVIEIEADGPGLEI